MLFIILIFIIIEEIHTQYKCGAGKLNIKPKVLDSKNLKKIQFSKQTSNSYHPIRIGFDFTSFLKPDSMNESIYEKLKTLIVEVGLEFKKFLQVPQLDSTPNDMKDILMDMCMINNIGKNYKKYFIDNDLIVFPKFSDTFDTLELASAYPCLEDYNLRPIAGTLIINSDLDWNYKNIELYMKNILLHEMTHILVFDQLLLDALDMRGQEGPYYYIKSPKVIEKAREHFNCSSLDKLYLEGQGNSNSAGIHWEARYMLGDYMISFNYIENTMSEMTLALFEDTGFYKVKYYSGGLFKFGKNKGCDFINKKCIIDEKPISSEFCLDNVLCTSSRTSKAFCYLFNETNPIPTQYQYFSNPYLGGLDIADYCPIPFNIRFDNDYLHMSCKVGKSRLTAEYMESIGNNSFCFISSLLPISSKTNNSDYKKICYEVNCDSGNKEIIIKVGTSEIVCPSVGGIIESPSGFKGSIQCPKYEDICSSKNNIICNEMFDCLTKEAEKDNYRYDKNINIYEEIYTGEEINNGEDNVEEEESEYIPPIRKSENNYIKFNIGLLFISLIPFFVN